MKIVEYDKIERNNCLAFDVNNLEHLYTFKNFPVFMGCTKEPVYEDMFFDMSWYIGKQSGLIQLNPLLPLEIVYKSGHGSGSVGKSWDEHHQSFAEFITQCYSLNVLEIGGLHGVLAKKAQKINPNIKWTIIEPNPCVENNSGINIITGFFDDKFESNIKYDAVVHSHVLEHSYDPNSFLQSQSLCLDTDGLLMFSVPNMEVMLRSKFLQTLHFEHTIFLTEPYIKYFLEKNNFKIIKKTYFKDNHSIFYCAKKTQNVDREPLPDGLYNKNKHLFDNFISTYLVKIDQLNKSINKTNNPVYLFGAHAFSQFLISFGLHTDSIISILDNDHNKTGKRLYGTDLMVESPAILKNLNEPLVILKAGVFNKEIKDDIINNVNKTVKFLE